MSAFMAFDSLDEMLKFQSAKEDEANARVTPLQAAIGHGDHWYHTHHGLLVCGKVWTQYEFEADWAHTERFEGASAATDACETQVDSWKRGYRFGRAYSTVLLDGELGSTHISEMHPLDRHLFEVMKHLRWSPQVLTTTDFWKEVAS